jgi:hypothetical protein
MGMCGGRKAKKLYGGANESKRNFVSRVCRTGETLI